MHFDPVVKKIIQPGWYRFYWPTLYIRVHKKTQHHLLKQFFWARFFIFQAFCQSPTLTCNNRNTQFCSTIRTSAYGWVQNWTLGLGKLRWNTAIFIRAIIYTVVQSLSPTRVIKKSGRMFRRCRGGCWFNFKTISVSFTTHIHECPCFKTLLTNHVLIGRH